MKKEGAFSNSMRHSFTYSASACQTMCQDRNHNSIPGVQAAKPPSTRRLKGPILLRSARPGKPLHAGLPVSLIPQLLCFLFSSSPTFPSSRIPNLSKDASGPPAAEQKTCPTSSASLGSLSPPSSLTPGLPVRTLSSERGTQVTQSL